MKMIFKKPAINVKKINFGWIKRIRQDAVWGIVAYLHILVFLPAILKKRDKFVRYHVRQGMALLLVWILFILSFFFPILPWVFAFCVLILLLSGIVNVILGKERPLPLIGKIAERF